MKLPSIHALTQLVMAAFKRFPLSILLAVTGSLFAILNIHLHYNDKDQHHYYSNITQSAYLGMLLLLALTIYGERNKLLLRPRIFLQFVGLVIIVLYYFSLPPHSMEIRNTQFFLFAIALHLLIAFVPFIGKGEINGFWQYNKAIFLRILMTALYSGVLYIGLSLAILAIDQLFKANIDTKLYGYLWVCIAGIFNTCFFLAGFPSEIEKLEERTDYPKGLKIFTQYVLLPIITIYLLILYAYMFKIILTAEWPFGWVSYLVLAFSIAGIFSLLLMYPIRNDENNRWILRFARFFYFAICPLIILLFLAIQRRIVDYGITENRYFVLALACWLGLIALYFIFSKIKNIKLIPVSLCLIVVCGSFGPWGAFSVSLRSQHAHLVRILEKNHLLIGQKIVPATDTVPLKDAKDLTSVVEYLMSKHGLSSLQQYFSQNLDSLISSDNPEDLGYGYAQANKLLSLMNVKYTNLYETENNRPNYFSFDGDNSSNHITPIEGFDYLISGYHMNAYGQDPTDTFYLGTGKELFVVGFNSKTNIITLQSPKDSTLGFDLSLLINSFKKNAYTQFSRISEDSMTLNAQHGDLSARIIVKNMHGEYLKEGIKINEISAEILVKTKHR